jgi:hypothetical protein
MIRLEQLIGRQAPYRVRYVNGSKPGNPITVVGYGNSGVGMLTDEMGGDHVAVFSGGGRLWLPDLLRHYELIEE